MTRRTFGPPKYDDARSNSRRGSVLAIHVKYLVLRCEPNPNLFPSTEGNNRESSVLLDSEGGGLDSVHPEDQSGV